MLHVVILVVADKMFVFFFFFQAEDGIRDKLVTGVQTCALPICSAGRGSQCRVPPKYTLAVVPVSDFPLFPLGMVALPTELLPLHIFEERYKAMVAHCLEHEIGRASCRERV